MGKIIVIGGGLGGLVSSIQLIRAGLSCTVIEKKSYPFHRVCGEYVSNEARSFLTASGLYPTGLDLPQIQFLHVSSISGHSSKLALDLGGFGISRYTFDHHLYNIAREEGVTFHLDTEVTGVHFEDGVSQVTTKSKVLTADVVIGAFGKRSRIDHQLDRAFIKTRSPWVGVKYHARTDHPADVIALHNFPRGYCGVCRVDNGLTNVCYLTHRENLKEAGDLHAMEESTLFVNPLIRDLFERAQFVFEKPEVINEVSFQTKMPIVDHVLMVGDAAGMITPVCGNGMAIAIHSGKIVAELVAQFCAGTIDRATLELRYREAWNDQFKRRLWFGRAIQKLFVQPSLSKLVVRMAMVRPLAGHILRSTHGQPF